MTAIFKDRIGSVYGSWEVISYVGKKRESKKWTHIYFCKCLVCGFEREIDSRRLYPPVICKNRCNKKSRETIHGMSRTNIYKLWITLKGRCVSKSSHQYHRYGGAGITICDKWLKFEGFYEDMGDRPSLTHSIDRKNGAKGYSKENCRWATPKEQANNKKTNRKVTAFGETKNMGQWAEEYGMCKRNLKYRLDQGVPPELALTIPDVRGTNILKEIVKQQAEKDGNK